MPNEAQESQVLMAPAARAGMLIEPHMSGCESPPPLGAAQGLNTAGGFGVPQRKLRSLRGGGDTAVYATDDGPSPVVDENSGHSGTTLREHDYIGLSVSSSSFQKVQNSPAPSDCENVSREEFNLNLGATELRLGPTSLRRSGSAAVTCATTANTEQQRAFISSMESSNEQTAAPERGAASSDYKFASRDQGFSTYTHVLTTLEKEEPSSVGDCAKIGFCRSFPNSDKWHEERGRGPTEDSLNLGIALMPNRSNSRNADADKKLFQHSEGSAMEEKNERQSDQQEILPQHAEEVVPSADSRICPEHCSSAIQEDPSPGSKRYTENMPLARGHQPNSMERPKQEMSMQENRVPEMQGAQDASPDSSSAPAASMHTPIMHGMHPSHPSQPDTSYPQEARYPQESILVNLDRTGIVQEFMAHKLKVQMRQAGGDNCHYRPAGAEHHLPHPSPQLPESRATNGTHTALPGSRCMFPLSKNGVGGAKRGFSEALGSAVPPESRSGPYTDSRNGFVEAGALREGSVGNTGRSNGTEMSQHSKHQLGAPPGSAMYPCSNPKPLPPSWQQSPEPSGGLFGPFRSQWPTQGTPPQMSNRADVNAVSGNIESNPKTWDSSWSKNNQETVATSETTKHPSSDTRPASLEETAPTSAPPPRQSQMVGWPPVRNFRKTLVQQQPARPAPQERQPRPTTTPQATSTVIPPPATPVNSGTQTTHTSLLVKVYMDGLSIGRKVDLTANNSYERLKSALEDMFQDMFQQFIRHPSDPQSSVAGETGMSSSCSQKFNFLHSSEYVLTYEDRESDLMLVGDVPWEMFTTIVRRLRIMKGVDIARRGGDNTTNPQVEAV